MSLLGMLNRWRLLYGLPGLRRVPFVRELPLVRGHFRICRLDFPASDRARFRDAVNEKTAAFIGPNHPEFGLDWMMDKEISTLFAPRMASWAAHGIVASAPWFWTKNNLVANNGGEAAKNYSVAWALRGHGVLLHPEGSVHWTAARIHRLFHGIADMAIEAARRTAGNGSHRPVFIVPIVWKYHHVRDVSASIHGELATIERGLSLECNDGLGVAERFYALQANILAGQMRRFDYELVSDPKKELGSDTNFFLRQDAFRMHLVDDLASRYPIEPSDSIDRTIARLKRAITQARADAGADRAAAFTHDLAKIDEASRLGGFIRDVYGTPLLTQEQIFESLKRLRSTLLNRGLINALHNYLPTPYGPRVAHVRVPEPIVIDPARACGDEAERATYVDELIEQTRERMQRTLDAINREIAAEVDSLSHANPFVERQESQRRDDESSASKPCRMDSGTRNADPCRIPRGVLSESEKDSQCSKSRVRTAP
jgi:hypothetical protein